MKDMIYSGERRKEILVHGMCFGFFYWIVSYGTHPCAYVLIPRNNKYFKKEYDYIDIDVHGGLTYSDYYLPFESKNSNNIGWYIGWDYAHHGDYTGCEEKLPKELRIGGKKWTIEEIKEDVFEVCKQLTEGNK